MAGIQLTGLVSGLDTDSIISQLLAAEGTQRTQITLKQAAISQRTTDLTSIRTKLTAVGSAATALASAATWADTQDVTSSTTSVADAKLTGGAAPGGVQLSVTRLAAAEQRTYAYAQQADASTISVGGRDVAVPAGADAAGAAAAINGAGAGVYAVAVEGRLVLGSRTTGAASSFAATGTALTEDASAARPGRDAAYSIDGGPERTSASNVITGAMAGVQLTLRSTGSSSVVVSEPQASSDAVVTQVKAFVDAYNAAVTTVRGELTEKRVPGATTAADAAKGALFGDTQLNDLLSRMRSSLDLTALGISTGGASATTSADTLAGKLTIDEGKLRDALGAPGGLDAVRAQLGDAATKLSAVLTPQTQADGLLDARLASATAEAAQQADALKRFDDRQATREDQLRKQFTALETAMAKSQSLQAQLFGS